MDGCNDLQVEVALEVRNVTGFCCCYLVAKSGFNSVIPCTVACRVPLSMGSSRQEYCSGLPFPSPEDLSDLGIEPMSLMSPALAGWFFTTSALGKPSQQSTVIQNCLPKKHGVLQVDIYLLYEVF